MSATRRRLVHNVAEDRQRPSGQTGQAVSGYATFYLHTPDWEKIFPGQLDLAELWGGASGFTKQNTAHTAIPEVEFYLDAATVNHPKRVKGFVALNGNKSNTFTFGFFGKRYS